MSATVKSSDKKCVMCGANGEKVTLKTTDFKGAVCMKHLVQMVKAEETLAAEQAAKKEAAKNATQKV